MTLLEKAKFIIGDYLNLMEEVGSMPSEKILAEKWFSEQFLPAQNRFVLKYASNSMSKFASKLAIAYGDAVEAEMKYMFTECRRKAPCFSNGDISGAPLAVIKQYIENQKNV